MEISGIGSGSDFSLFTKDLLPGFSSGSSGSTSSSGCPIISSRSNGLSGSFAGSSGIRVRSSSTFDCFSLLFSFKSGSFGVLIPDACLSSFSFGFLLSAVLVFFPEVRSGAKNAATRFTKESSDLSVISIIEIAVKKNTTT